MTNLKFHWSFDHGNQNKDKQKNGKGRKIALCVFAAVARLILITACTGLINANLLRIRRAEVVLLDLPQAFDGKTILFASDIDIFGINTPARAGELFNQLQSLRPDILILGGDYNSASLLNRLNHSENSNDNTLDILKSRSDFFRYIGIANTEDVQWQKSP